MEFREVAAEGSTESSRVEGGEATWQVIIRADGSFDFVLENVRGDSGMHTIGFQGPSSHEPSLWQSVSVCAGLRA